MDKLKVKTKTKEIEFINSTNEKDALILSYSDVTGELFLKNIKLMMFLHLASASALAFL
ncbi:MAG: hypothetical protein KAT68_17065 [Bacteroidales bacterium]|nr:hypothetical protein [Bacteroidales bacterium]